jgi:hypothetical protein
MNWVRPKALCLQVPLFARHTVRYPPQNPPNQPWPDLIRTFIVQQLGIPHWDDNEHLIPEIQRFLDVRREFPRDWKDTCSYLFEALKRALKELPEGGQYQHSILKMCCFPVVRKNNVQEIWYLTSEIFVFDSPSLNKLFRGKIDALDFGVENAYPLRQLLKKKIPSQNFLSFHDTDTDIEIPSGFIDSAAVELQQIREKERYITR